MTEHNKDNLDLEKKVDQKGLENNVEEKKDNDLEEMIKQASSKPSEYKEVSKNSKTRNNVIAASVFAVAIASVVGLAAMQDKGTEFENKTKEPEWITKAEEKKNIKYSEDWDFDYPVEVEPWAKEEFSKNFFNNEEEILKYTGSIEGVQTALIQIPSKETKVHGENGTSTPYTSNIEEMYLKNGEENKYYKHVLREDYEMSFAMVTQRLINPLFGQWIFAQKSDFPLQNNDTYEILSNMFDENWWETTTANGDYSKLPLLVDWSSTDWNDWNLADRVVGRYGTFYGKIEESSERKIVSKSIGLDEFGSRKIHFEVPVTYYAFKKNGGTVKKFGTLSFVLKSGQDGTSQDFKVIASDAKLVLQQ